MNTDNEKRPRTEAEGANMESGAELPLNKDTQNQRVVQDLQSYAVEAVAKKIQLGEGATMTALSTISEDECREILKLEDFWNSRVFVPSATPSPYERLLQCTIRRTPMAPKRFLAEWQDARNKYISVFPEYGFTTLCGQAKCGKTTALTYAMGAFVLGEYGGLRFQTSEKDVLTYCDTEQDTSDTFSVVRANLINIVARMKSCSTEQAEAIVTRRVHLMNVKILSKADRMAAIAAAVSVINPRITIIDGPRDLVDDINNQTEATALNEFYANLQTKTTLVAVVHQNFGSEKVRGAIGSESYNKGDIIEVSKDSEGAMSMKYLISRNRTPEHPISFTRDDCGVPVPMGYADPYDKVKEAMEINKTYKRPELLEIIKRELGLKERSADSFIKRLQTDSDIDFRDERPNKYTKTKCALPIDDVNLPF